MDYTIEATGDEEMEEDFQEVMKNADLEQGDTIVYRQSVKDSKRLIDGEEVSPNEMVKSLAEAFEEFDNDDYDIGISHISIQIEKSD